MTHWTKVLFTATSNRLPSHGRVTDNCFYHIEAISVGYRLAYIKIQWLLPLVTNARHRVQRTIPTYFASPHPFWSLRLYCFLYWAFLGVAGVALEAAANLNVTSEQLLDYSNAKNSQRLTLEIAAATMWFLLFILDLSDVIRYFGPFILSRIFVPMA